MRADQQRHRLQRHASQRCLVGHPQPFHPFVFFMQQLQAFFQLFLLCQQLLPLAAQHGLIFINGGRLNGVGEAVQLCDPFDLRKGKAHGFPLLDLLILFQIPLGKVQLFSSQFREQQALFHIIAHRIPTGMAGCGKFSDLHLPV